MRYLTECDRSTLMGVSIENPKNWGTLGSAPLGTGRVWPLKQAPSHMCYHVKFIRFASKGVGYA